MVTTILMVNNLKDKEIQDVVTETNQHTGWEIISLKYTHSKCVYSSADGQNMVCVPEVLNS